LESKEKGDQEDPPFQLQGFLLITMPVRDKTAHDKQARGMQEHGTRVHGMKAHGTRAHGMMAHGS
jgi:hypothetical protein